MTYFEFLFSQLFMVQLNKYCYFEYDQVYDDIKFYIEEYHNSEYSQQNKSEYECINDFLSTIILPYIKFSQEYLQVFYR